MMLDLASYKYHRALWTHASSPSFCSPWHSFCASTHVRECSHVGHTGGAPWPEAWKPAAWCQDEHQNCWLWWVCTLMRGCACLRACERAQTRARAWCGLPTQPTHSIRAVQGLVPVLQGCVLLVWQNRGARPADCLVGSRHWQRTDGTLGLDDAGLSNIMRDGHFLKTSCGSPNYAAPEVSGFH